MNTPILYLSKDENTALNTLFSGYSAEYYREVNRYPINGWFAFTANIRRKTGIENLKNRSEVRLYLERYAAAMAGPGPTPDQTYLMRLFIKKLPPEAIAGKANIEISEIEPQLNSACKSAGIFTQDVRARRSQCRLYLAIFRPNGTPPHPQEMELLRLMGKGTPFDIIAQQWLDTTLEAVIYKARELCIRLGFDTTGRNAQRHLIRDYVEWMDARAQEPAPVTMDDPMF